MNWVLRPTFAVIMLLPATADAAGFAHCLLSRLPGADNDAMARAALHLCLQSNPGGFLSVEQGAGRGLFSFKSGAECTIEKAKGTRSNQAAHLIASACRKLYDEPARSEVEDFLDAAEARRR